MSARRRGKSPEQAAAKVAKRIARNATNISNAMDKALFKLMVDLIINKTLPITPIEFGVLRQSAFVSRAKDGNVKGGFSAKYAVAVHERVFAGGSLGPSRKVFHKGPTQAKFLETAFNAFKPTFARRLAKETTKQWRKNWGRS